MDLTAYLRVFRQRWKVVLLPCLAALLAAVFTLPEGEEDPGPVVTSYQATATLIASPTTPTETVPLSLPTVALFATIGEIPKRAADMLDYDGEPQLLAQQVTVTANSETGTLAISSTDDDGRAAAERVNSFARATMAYFEDQAARESRARAEELNRQLELTASELDELPPQGTDAVSDARIQALNTQYSTQLNELTTITRDAANSAQLAMLQPGVPIPQATQSFTPPSNPFVRIGIAGLLGLLLGAVLALVVERLDSRMRTRSQVEDAMGLPVLAEIPVMPRRHRGTVVSAARPASMVAEAFRTLRSSILLSPGLITTRRRNGRVADALVIMVTSARPSEGKTTSVANLAAVMAEAGRRVLVLSLDLRTPRIHDLFQVTNRTGTSDLLAADRSRHLGQVAHETDVPGVSIVTSGHHLDHPGALLADVGSLIHASRSLADVVLVDTPPVLTVSDALDIATHVDMTLLVTRLNKTTRTEAAECQRLFGRVGISALGAVLVGSRPAGARYGEPVPESHDYAFEDEDDEAATARAERD